MKELIQSYKDQYVELSALIVVNFDPVDEIRCHICGEKSENENMFICDFCGYGEHQSCLGSKITGQ